ncbi:hypothetical protein OHA98_20750 [Streptomyces sp. NBC_00654]|uniref:hypothetical protein n=1 Tax=Streptomyces sp. NBC_00654 TaxID=2975799 RepID=UPI002255B5F2|nr:hypothetical protein [Streptomyces sp. NBC_00654]MCX4967169.1 hypothetical protein [Streptomyces sp. NBC_00654]
MNFTGCKAEAVEREDYTGRDVVTCDGEAQPIMRVEKTCDDGTDVAVLTPCATSRSGVN